MKNFLLITLFTVTFSVFAQKQVFESPQLKSAVSTHKIVAILPFKVTITQKNKEADFDASANKELELTRAKSIQSSLYTFLLRKQKQYTVSFQDVEKTNLLLLKAGVSDKLDQLGKDEISKILGVDAILGGTYDTQQTRSEEGAMVSAFLLGGGIYGKTGEDALTLTINNGTDGELLWRFYKNMNQSLMTSTEDIVNQMMRKVSRNFPYTAN